jgi:hypothetical protein
MAQVDLSITLADGQNRFRSREPMRGEVRALVHETCDVDLLRLALVHHSRYDTGLEKNSPLTGVTLFTGGRWNAGEQYSYPFEIPAPGFPPTYHGKLMSLTWRLEAKMHRAHEDSVVGSQPFELLPAERAGVSAFPSTPADPTAVNRVGKTPLFVTAGMGLAGLGLTALGHTSASTFAFVAGIVVGALGLIGFLLSLRGWRDRKRAGNIQLDFVSAVGDAYRTRGDAADVQCVVWTRPDPSIAKVEVRLVARELLAVGYQKAESEKRRAEIYNTLIELNEGSPGQYQGLLPFTSDEAIWSLDAGTGGNISAATISWEATATVHLCKPRGIVQKSVAFRVRPAAGAGSAAEQQ